MANIMKKIFILIFVALFIIPLTKVNAATNVKVVFFSTPGCSECALTRNYLESLKEVYPQIEIIEYSVSENKNKELLSQLGNKYGLKENQINVTPAVFIGEKAFVREETFHNLDKVIENLNPEENTFLEKALQENTENSQLVEMFKKFGVLTVVSAGLIDGYNPCAITVLIFFISLLTLKGKSKKEMLLVGVSFILGIGVSYLLLGIGLFQIIAKWKYFDFISRWVYLVTALITFILVVLTFSDYFKAKKGNTKNMTLQLSYAEKKSIHTLLRKRITALESLSAFLIAFPVSIVEFSCTGQTYLPTIVYIFSMENLEAKALVYLILYNFMFIVPLVVITVFAYKGATSERITTWFRKNIATIKLFTGIIFLLLFTYLLVKTLSLFGLINPII